jgi:DNA repair protein RadC
MKRKAVAEQRAMFPEMQASQEKQELPPLKPEADYLHPGGKLLYTGSETCTDEELVAILIGYGCKGRPAKQIADEIVLDWYSVNGLLNKFNRWHITMEDLLKYRCMDRQKAERVLAGLELAKRICKYVGYTGRTLEMMKDDRPDEEVLASLFRDLRTSLEEASKIAKAFLERYNDLLGLMGKPLVDILEVKGIGKVKVARIGAVYEIARRTSKRENLDWRVRVDR